MDPDSHIVQRVQKVALDVLEPQVQEYASKQARIALAAAWAELYGGSPARPAPPSEVDEGERKARMETQDAVKRQLSLDLASELQARLEDSKAAAEAVVPAPEPVAPATPAAAPTPMPVMSSEFLHAYAVIFACQNGAPVGEAELNGAYAVLLKFLEESGRLEKAESEDEGEDEPEKRDFLQRVTDRHIRANNSLSRATFAARTHPLVWPLPQPGRRRTVNVALVNTTASPGILHLTATPGKMKAEEDRRKDRQKGQRKLKDKASS